MSWKCISVSVAIAVKRPRVKPTNEIRACDLTTAPRESVNERRTCCLRLKPELNVCVGKILQAVCVCAREGNNPGLRLYLWDKSKRSPARLSNSSQIYQSNIHTSCLSRTPVSETVCVLDMTYFFHPKQVH